MEALGFKLVIFPGSAFMLVCKAVEELMGQLKQRGTTVDFMDRMASLNQSFEMVGLSDMLAQDAKYADYVVAAVEHA